MTGSPDRAQPHATRIGARLDMGADGDLLRILPLLSILLPSHGDQLKGSTRPPKILDQPPQCLKQHSEDSLC